MARVLFRNLVEPSDNYSFYTGIGSRKTPDGILWLMSNIAHKLEELGFILRSGGADGADFAFESGVKLNGNKDIFLPWSGFNNNTSKFYDPPEIAFEIASKHYPIPWNKVKDSVKRLMARNCQQILGKSCNSSINIVSKFIICWTPDGATENTTKLSGGTGQAIRVAKTYGVPVFNLFNSSDRDEVMVALGF